MNYFFTSDTHFGHENIIRLANRPFSSVEEMNETLIERWNERITKNDVVYHLGDFMWRQNRVTAVTLMQRLHFKEFHWIRGNHDYDSIIKAISHYVSDIQLMAEVNLPDCPLITLIHYPMQSWNKSLHGSWQLFGHHHNTTGAALLDPAIVVRPTQMDVSVEGHDFYPWSLDEIKTKLAQQTDETVPRFDLRQI
jgi:calcineurin-like phosphoesterase family protein